MRAANLAIAVVSILAVLVGVEVFVRSQIDSSPPQQIYPSKETRKVEGGRVFCPDPEVTRPYFESRKRYPGCVFYPRNNVGSRNLFDVHADAQPRFRIVGLGDSMVYGYGVDHEDTFLYRLHESLTARLGSERIEVINSARPGDDLDDAYQLLRGHVLPLEPDLIILGLHLNDCLVFPTQLIRTTYDTPIREYFHLLDLLLSRWELKASGDLNEKEILASYDDESKARLFRQLRAFAATLAKRDIPLLVLIFPLFVDLDEYSFRHIHREIGEFMTAERIDYFDFLRDFSEGGDDTYWITLDDQHPNERAHQVFFERVSGYLDEHLGPG